MLAFLGSGTNAAQGLLPQGIVQSMTWIPVALSAGFCEELAFRGYLQKQFQAITGSAGWAVLIQAIVFGIGHLYEGVGPVARITLFGVLFGLLALWRKSLRPGMIAHAWSDIFGVIIFRGMEITAIWNLSLGSRIKQMFALTDLRFGTGQPLPQLCYATSIRFRPFVLARLRAA
jgi:membrane protease YdiL (CAAX protease family)